VASTVRAAAAATRVAEAAVRDRTGVVMLPPLLDMSRSSCP
jgi:hypothetical protein